MSRTLQGKVVAVVGTGGLGRALAESLAERGSTVIVAGRSGAVDVTIELTDADAGAALVDHALTLYGRLDGVVIAAGVVAFGDLESTEDTVIEELLLVNALGPLWLAKRVVPALRESRGFLVNLSGVVAATPSPGMVAYSASKASVAAGFQALGRELRRAGVLVCDAQPPHTETGLATRPIAGSAPRFGPGLDPRVVADRVVAGIEADQSVITAADF
jgi:NAD(P)-dependent dehydrogenase (short-subunit alcohol dehydrogenase family)